MRNVIINRVYGAIFAVFACTLKPNMSPPPPLSLSPTIHTLSLIVCEKLQNYIRSRFELFFFLFIIQFFWQLHTQARSLCCSLAFLLHSLVTRVLLLLVFIFLKCCIQCQPLTRALLHALKMNS